MLQVFEKRTEAVLLDVSVHQEFGMRLLFMNFGPHNTIKSSMTWFTKSLPWELVSCITSLLNGELEEDKRFIGEMYDPSSLDKDVSFTLSQEQESTYELRWSQVREGQHNFFCIVPLSRDDLEMFRNVVLAYLGRV